MKRLTVLLIILAALVLMGTTAPVFAQPVRELSPDACVQIGLQNNRAVRAARQQARDVRSSYHAARTARLPLLSGQGTYQRLSDNIPDFEVALALPGTNDPSDGVFEVPAILDRYDFRLQAHQSLFTGGRLSNSIRAARYEAEAAQEHVAATERELAYTIREAFWTLVEAETLQAAADVAQEQVAEHLQDVENLRTQGMALESDVLAVKTRLAEARLTALDAERTVRIARLTLNQRMGVPYETVVTPVDDVEVEPLALTADELVSQAWHRHPALAALEYETKALEAGVKVAQAAWLPQVALVGTYDYARPNPYVFPQEERFTGTWEAGVSMSMDLWDWGRRRSQTQQAEARAARSREQLAEGREALRLEVMRAVLHVEHATAAVEVAQQGLDAAAESYRVLRARVRHGMALTTDMLAAEAALRTAEARHVQALTDYAVARAALLRATGEPTLPR